MRRFQAEAVITVFFTLLCTVYLALLFILAESVRIQGARAQAANIVDMGNYSLFGEFEKQLLQEYEIFAVDGAYGTEQFEVGKLRERMQHFMEYNIRPDAEGLPALCFEPWRLSLGKLNITEYALLSDRSGEYFYQQAVSYMRETAVTGIAGRLYALYQEACGAQTASEQYEKEKGTSDAAMQQLEKTEERLEQEAARRQKADGAETALEVAKPEPRMENPLKALNRLRRKSLLRIVCGEKAVSKKKVSGFSLYSKRWGNQKGTLALPMPWGGLMDHLIFREYLLSRFPCFTSKGKEKALEYQIEYLLCGKKTDEANLKGTVQRLLLLREACNYGYSIGDPELSGDAEGIATMVIGWTGIPELVGILKHALLIGLSYAESLMDVRILLSGGGIPLYKTADTWQISFRRLAQINELLDAGGTGARDGLHYPDYLRILLNLQGVGEQKIRGLDLVELNIRSREGLSNFRVDHCVVGIKTSSEWVIPPLFGRISGLWLGRMAPQQEVTVKSGFVYE